ncbi:MAG: hypothetical protein IT456_25630 [Planctomycetes bacterium]|nr:hypothetical protein [Planctomycetota bacterium]
MRYLLGSVLSLLFLVACASLRFLREGEAEGEAPDFPNAALQWRAERQQDENGNIPAQAWQQALQSRAALVATVGAVDDGGISPLGWVQRGPFNVAGRSRTLAIDPRDSRVLWSGGVSGGLWKSVDRGITWNTISDWWTNLSIASLTLDPNNPDIMYVGTGEGFFNDNVARGVNRSAIRGAGVFQSTDGGVHWAQLPATAGWQYTQRIVVQPGNSNVLLASVRPGGIYRSIDGGTSWTQVRTAFSSDQVLFDPNDGSKAVGHVVDASLGLHDVVWSTDGGATWTNALSGLVGLNSYDARVELCYARSSPGVVYGSTGLNGGTVWRSADGGQNWLLRTGASSTGVSWYFNGFWVDPTNENVMVAAGLHVWRSVNGGVSFSQISNGYIMTVVPHLDVHNVVADPDYDGTTSRRVYVMTDGGLHVADNVFAAAQNSGWRDLDNGMPSTQFYGAAGVAGSNLLVGGAQDNGTQRLLGASTTSNMPFGGDGGQVQIDPTNNNYIYGEYVWAQVHRSSNGGSSSNFITGNISETTAATANFITPLLLDPTNATRLYVGASSLWRTNNSRASSMAWSIVKPATTSKISALAIAASDGNTMWVAHNDGRLYRSSNATAATPTWVAVDDNAGLDPLPNRYITRLAIDPTNHSVVWATMGGFASGNVRVTRDGGLGWSDASGVGSRRLPDAPVNCIVLHPDDPNVLYVATEVGVFASDDAGQSWSANNDGPNNAPVEQVVFEQGSRKLIAATLGRGLWTCDVHRPSAVAFGAPCTGDNNPPTIEVDPQAPARIGQTMQWVGHTMHPNGVGFLAVGFSDTAWSGGSLPSDLGPVGMPGCSLLVSPDVFTLSFADGSGVTRVPLTLPGSTGFVGLVLFGQWAVQDPPRNALGFAVSAGLRVVIGQ